MGAVLWHPPERSPQYWHGSGWGVQGFPWAQEAKTTCLGTRQMLGDWNQQTGLWAHTKSISETSRKYQRRGKLGCELLWAWSEACEVSQHLLSVCEMEIRPPAPSTHSPTLRSSRIFLKAHCKPRMIQLKDFPGGSEFKTPHSQCRGHRFHPWLGS